MSKEDLTQEEEVEETTPAPESESDDAAELDSLFADDDSEESDDEDKVAKLEKKLENIEKGVKKYFSEQGRKAKEEETAPVIKKEPTNDLDDVSEWFLSQTPEAEPVQDDLKTVADAKYNGSIIKAWKNESWIQEKATALEAAKKVEEENKTKVSKPSNGAVSSSKVDISKVKAEDVSSLKPAEKIAWLKAQANKERNAID